MNAHVAYTVQLSLAQQKELELSSRVAFVLPQLFLDLLVDALLFLRLLAHAARHRAAAAGVTRTTTLTQQRTCHAESAQSCRLPGSIISRTGIFGLTLTVTLTLLTLSKLLYYCSHRSHRCCPCE